MSGDLRCAARKAATFVFACVFATVAWGAPGFSQKYTERMNANTLGVVAGNIHGTYLRLADDLAAVLNDADTLRVMPIIGGGGGQNVLDVRYLRGVDLGFTQASIVDVYRRDKNFAQVGDRIAYITKLYTDELHIITRRSITSVEQLKGQKISLSQSGSNTDITGRDILARLGIDFQPVNMGHGDGLLALKRGEIAAVMQMTAKPTPTIARIKGNEDLHLLPVPFAKPLQAQYLPVVLTNADYPELIRPGERVESIGGEGVLIAYNWPKNTDRYKRIERFVHAFFTRFEEFRKPPRHPKWKETNLAATVPGMTRFPAAQEWLDKNRPESVTREEFDRFVGVRASAGAAPAKQLSASDRERLFQEFLQWRKTSGAR